MESTQGTITFTKEVDDWSIKDGQLQIKLPGGWVSFEANNIIAGEGPVCLTIEVPCLL